ncbi:hypothetical protein GCM10022226_47090 [Sphaerisporangium flaviroseum]|uniref:Uncharacterized protein n=1 Tax=Sphaerisporangium flaviroseum TaxID=509199 RepID=A0ABP7ILA3_9ACTN
MEPSHAIRRIGKLLIQAGYKLSKESTINSVLVEMAGQDGAAAARVLSDLRASRFPENELRSAITLLRGSYEKYHRRSMDRSLRERIRAHFGATGGPEARFRGATVALTIAYLYKAVDDDGPLQIWLERGTADFLASYESVVPGPARSGTRELFHYVQAINPADPIGGSSRTVRVPPYTETYTTAADSQDYAKRLAHLRAEFEETRRDLLA